MSDAELRQLEYKAAHGSHEDLLAFVKAALRSSSSGDVANLEAAARTGDNLAVVRYVKAALAIDDGVQSAFFRARDRLSKLDEVIEEAERKAEDVAKKAADVAAASAKQSLEARLAAVSEDASKAATALSEVLSRSAGSSTRTVPCVNGITTEPVYSRYVPGITRPDGTWVPEANEPVDPHIPPGSTNTWPYITGYEQAKPPSAAYSRENEFFWRALVVARINDLVAAVGEIREILRETKLTKI